MSFDDFDPIFRVWEGFSMLYLFEYTVDSRYLDFGYLEQPLISKRKSDPCINIEI